MQAGIGDQASVAIERVIAAGSGRSRCGALLASMRGRWPRFSERMMARSKTPSAGRLPFAA